MGAGEGADELWTRSEELRTRSELFAERAIEAVDLKAEVYPQDMEKIAAALADAFRVGFLAAGDVPARPLVDPQRKPRVARAAIGGGGVELGRGRKRVK
ncbi:MAG TPA: hypothetical protein VF495_22680 [Phenylobacterium sp.]